MENRINFINYESVMRESSESKLLQDIINNEILPVIKHGETYELSLLIKRNGEKDIVVLHARMIEHIFKK